MGLHTWFYKNADLYDEQVELYKKIDIHETGLIWLDDMDMFQINSRIDEIDKLNDAKCSDLFRTTKREPDGEYTLDVIRSKKECDKWLLDNADTVYGLNKSSLDKFWDNYPNGVINFG